MKEWMLRRLDPEQRRVVVDVCKAWASIFFGGTVIQGALRPAEVPVWVAVVGGVAALALAVAAVWIAGLGQQMQDGG